jgi:serine phosphatase RsbU (regulator of sigma subunit)/anti-sigma regulatory factor (Ser/Thr protein kinase)
MRSCSSAAKADAAGLQTAAAEYGRFALESRDIAVTIERAVDLVAQALNASTAALIRLVRAGKAEVICGWGGLLQATGTEFELPAPLAPATWTTPPEAVRDWRAFGAMAPPSASWLAGVRSSLTVGVPLERRPCGLIVMGTAVDQFGDLEVDFVRSVAHLLAAAMARHRVEVAQAAVAAFGEFALRSPTLDATLERAVDVVAEGLDTPFGFLIRAVGNGRVEVLHGRGPLGEAFGGEADASAELAERLRSTQPVVSGAWLPAEGLARLPGHQTTSAASLTVGVPLDGEQYRLGVTDTDTRQFGDTEADFLQAIAHLVAAAMNRDRAERRLRDMSGELQRALLPAALPVLDRVESRARYVTSGGDRVGGDWYDVLPLPHGGIGLVMGDVEGHDSAAAAVMGQVRNVLRAHVAEGQTPAEILARVNRFVVAHTDLLVTCCYAELRPEDLTLTCVSAGHPVPMVLDPDGSLRKLPVEPGLLLGVNTDHDYVERTSLLPAGCDLLMATDGLIDEFKGAIHVGFDAFAAVARAVAGQPIEVLADRLVARPEGAAPLRDDAALLVVRLTGGGGTDASAVHRRFAPSPSASPAARRFVADVLAGWDLADLRDSATLATSELVTNAVMHTTSSARLTLRRQGRAGVWIGVHDTNDRIPVRRVSQVMDTADPDRILAPGGRGLAIIEQIADRWGISPTPETGGKTVWLVLSDSE